MVNGNSSDMSGLTPLVGMRIRQARSEKGLSQKDLVGARFSKSYISSIERGKITPSLKALEYIARRLNVSVSFLLTGADAESLPDKNRPAKPAKEEAPYTGESVQPGDFALLEARIMLEQGNPGQAFEVLAQNFNSRLGGAEQLKLYHLLLAQAHYGQGNYSEALAELEKLRDLAEKTGDQAHLVRAGLLGGRIYVLLNKPVMAIEQLRLALQRVESGEFQDPQLRLGLYHQLGSLYHQLGDNKEAVEMFKRALDPVGSQVTPLKLAELYWQQAQACQAQGNLEQARHLAARSLSFYDNMRDMRLLVELHSAYGRAMLDLRQFEEARARFETAYNLATSQADLRGQIRASTHLLDLFLEQNDLEKARRYANWNEESLAALEPELRGQALSSRAALLTALGEADQAIKDLEEALRLIETTPAKELLSKIYFRYARALNAQGETTRAAEMFERAYRQLGRPALIVEQ